MSVGATGKTSTADAWNASGATELATSNQVNLLDNTANNVFITGIDYYIGTANRDFPHRSIAEEEAIAKKYYTKSYNLTTAPASATGAGSALWYSTAHSSGAGQMRLDVRFPTRMRAAPTVVAYPLTSTPNQVSVTSGNVAATYQQASEAGVHIVGTTTANTVRWIQCQWTADAEL